MEMESPNGTRDASPLTPYDRGFTPAFALASDPRFSYSLYVPDTALRSGSRPGLIVSVHGTGRSFSETLQSLGGFARWHNCLVLCPLFPAGVLGDRNLHGYKYLTEGDIRYDLVLLDMIAEVSARYGLPFERFALCGFSGGGHFVHRFLILHPRLLWAASIGSPGSVTLLDHSSPWWTGTANIRELFGIEVDIEALRAVPIQMVVGAADLETWEIQHSEGSRYWMPDANRAGTTRPERLKTLKRSFEEHGIPVEFKLLPGAAHDERKYLGAALDFLREAAPGSRNETRAASSPEGSVSSA